MDATSSVDGAKLAQAQANKLQMYPGGTVDIRVVRKLDKPFTVHVQTGKETRSIVIPPQETTKLVREYWALSQSSPFNS
jgi:hypothetical protein